MTTLLHVQASPQGSRSSSLAVADHFLEAYRAQHPEDVIETINVWQMDLPEFDHFAIEAKYAVIHQQTQTPEQVEAWDAVGRIVTRFKSADKYLFSLPMWNFSIPYKLKQFIDILVQPGLTVAVSETGTQGMITGKPAVGVYARGFALGPGTGAESADFQSPYLRHILGFIGFTELTDIFVEPTLGGPTAKDDAVAAAKIKAAEVALTF